MRVLSVFVSVLLAGSAWAQAPAAVYTPSHRDLDVPTYVNATVVRADTRARAIIFRSESGEVRLTAEGEALARLGRVRPGDEVLLGYRMDDRGGRPVRIVTAILSGQELADRGLLTAATSPRATIVRTGRVVRVDRNRQTLTFTDETGRVDSVAVRGDLALGTLGTLVPGDQVDVTFIPGATTGAGLVGAVDGIAIASTPTFVTGEVVGVDARGDLRLRTAFGDHVFPVMGAINLSSGRDFNHVRVGQTVRLDLGTSGSRSVVTGLSAVDPRLAGTGTVSSPGAVGVVPGTAGGVIPQGTVAVPLGSLPIAATPLPGTPTSTGLANVGTAGAPAAMPDGGFTTISQPASPFASVIPSLPSTVGTLNVVPPPASAPGLAEQYPAGALRDLATRDYDSAVRTLAMKANEIDMHWFRYRDGCLRSSSTEADIDRRLYGGNRDREWFVLFDEDVRTPADDNCRQLRVEMDRMAMDWRELMTRSEDTARKHDVLPGAMRDIRGRYRVEF
jgi:hypothetical protein